MTDYANDAAWKEKLSQAVFSFYLDHGAPARFYIRDCIPNKLLDYIEPGLANKYGAIAAYVNVGEYDDISLTNRVFVLFTTGGIVAYGTEAVNFRDWGKLAKYYSDNKSKGGDKASCFNLTEQISKKIAPSLVGKCPDLGGMLVALVSRALRILVRLEQLPPDQLPYLPLPSEDKAAPNPAATALGPKPAHVTDKYAVDF